LDDRSSFEKFEVLIFCGNVFLFSIFNNDEVKGEVRFWMTAVLVEKFEVLIFCGNVFLFSIF